MSPVGFCSLVRPQAPSPSFICVPTLHLQDEIIQIDTVVDTGKRPSRRFGRWMYRHGLSTVSAIGEEGSRPATWALMTTSITGLPPPQQEVSQPGLET